MCPHANEICVDARFDGKVLSCRHHEWEFDRTTGDCIKGKPCKLAKFPVEIKDGEIHVDVVGIDTKSACLTQPVMTVD